MIYRLFPLATAQALGCGCLGLALLFVPGRATAQVVVVPTGSNDDLVTTAAVGQAVVERLNASKPGQARLAYPVAEKGPLAEVDRLQAAGDVVLARALKAFERLEFAEVREETNRALKSYKAQLKLGGSARGYLQTLHLQAAAAIFDGDGPEAFRAMNDAVVFRRTPPSKKRFNPTVQQLYRKIANQPAGEFDGTVVLQTKPEAIVWFNRKLYGPARGEFTLRAGLYLVKVHHPKRKPWLRWIRVRPNDQRRLAISLEPSSAAETGIVVALRRESAEPLPGPAVASALEMLEAKELLLVGAQQPCKPERCEITLRWAKGRQWTQQNKATYTGKPDPAAARLIAAGAPEPEVVKEDACTLDSQCGAKGKCIDGRCKTSVSITRKWWFWTAVGVVAAGVAVAIIVPLTRPDGPVIEIR